jgi:membrane associated rhomboid family serine protease
MNDISATMIILGITVIVSFICFSNDSLLYQLKHYPRLEQQSKQYYRWLTSGFVHADIMHLFVNMFVFHSFGSYVEKLYQMQYGESTGKIVFTIVYLLVIVFANLSTYVMHRNESGYSAVGASGGVAGILFIFILSNPWSMLGVMMIIPVPAIIFGGLYLWYESYAAKNINDNVGHDAHFNGAIGGVLLALLTLHGIFGEFITKLMGGW